MRILMIVPKYPFPVVGGLERQSHELAKALIAHGHTLHALSSRFDPGQPNSEVIDGVRVLRIPWVGPKLVRFILLPFNLARCLYRIRRNVDLVHVHNISWFGAFVAAFAKGLGLPVMTKLPNIGDHGIPGMRRRPFGFLLVAVLKRSDAVIAMTPESLAELAGIGYPPERILKVTNGIPPLQAEFPTKHSAQSTTVDAIFVGRLSPEKGLSDLLRAWEAIKTRTTHPVRLRLIGDGPQAAELRSLALSLGLGESVEFFGRCGDVPAELAKADIFVLPSYAEGNSNAILEAMRAGLPIVATRVGGASIQVGREGDRFLFPAGDRDGLVGRLLELVEDKPLRLRVGVAMRARLESMFAIDRLAAIYAQAYELILLGRGDEIGGINPTLLNLNESQA